MPTFKRVPDDLGKQLYDAMWATVGEFQVPAWLLKETNEPQPISRAERIHGLAMLWSEARVSFAYWEERADLDWDAAFQSFLPRVEAAEDPGEYYRLLQEFVALLREGHSYVAPPDWVLGARATPPVAVRYVEGQPVVVRGEVLPPGTVITAVDGRAAPEVLAELARTVPASTSHDRMQKACNRLLLGAKGSEVLVAIRRPDGGEEAVRLVRTGSLPPRPLFARQELGEGRVLVRINGWHDPKVVDLFHEAFPDFDGVSALIIDQRYNGGGNSANGEKVLARLLQEPLPPYETSETPLYWGGMRVYELHHLMLKAQGTAVEPDTGRPRFGGPVVVLTSHSTFSAAEDFCIAFRSSRRGLIVGEATGGSTGNPSVFPLPGGGIGAVSATRVTFADGTPLIGVGVLPDVACSPTIAGLAAGRDEVLERALKLLGEG
ncbi:MAG: S41 family peptidase [Bacillota bacterium]